MINSRPRTQRCGVKGYYLRTTRRTSTQTRAYLSHRQKLYHNPFTCQLGVVKLFLMPSKSYTKLIKKLDKINELLQTQEENGWLYAIPTPARDTRLMESINAILAHYNM